MSRRNGTAPSDKVGAAISAVEGEQVPESVTMEGVTVTIASTGRPFQIAFPTEPLLSEVELLEVVGWMTTQLRMHLAQRRTRPALSRLVIPH